MEEADQLQMRKVDAVNDMVRLSSEILKIIGTSTCTSKLHYKNVNA